MIRDRIAGLLFLLLIVLVTTPGRAEAPPVHHTELANGMRVVVQRYPGFPFVGMTLRYRTGYRDDPAGLSGLTGLTWLMMHERSAHVRQGGGYEIGPRAAVRAVPDHAERRDSSQREKSEKKDDQEQKPDGMVRAESHRGYFMSTFS